MRWKGAATGNSMKDNVVLVVTGTISPPADSEFLKLQDAKERLRQYKEGLLSCLESGAFSKVVFCENSNFGTERLSAIKERAEELSVQLELFSFAGDTEGVRRHGKGFGEGEIMKYVFANSRLVQEEDLLVKLTGRMKVDNLSEIVSRLKENGCYFNIPNRTHREMFDTRMYAMPVSLFRQLFLEAYKQVDDRKGKYLEIVYTGVLSENGIKVRNFPRYPRMVGMSASTGADYVYTEWKCKIKDVLSKFNYYMVKRQETR